jgi:hypothetical protein
LGTPLLRRFLWIQLEVALWSVRRLTCLVRGD